MIGNYASGAARRARRVFAALCVLAPGFAWPADAGWREEIGTFRVGMVAELGAGNTIEGLGALNKAFGDALGMKVEFFVASSYAALIDAQVSRRIDYAIYSASAYASAYRRCECVEPLVAPVGEDGSIGVRAVLIARDRRLTSEDDLAGHRIALPPPDSIAANRLALATFRPRGRPLSGRETFLVAAPSAEAAEAMLAEGSVDALFGWMPAAAAGGPEPRGGTLSRLAAQGVDPATLRILWRSPPLRYGPHAVANDLDPEAKQRLAAFLIGLRKADPDIYERLETQRSGGFVAVSRRDYDVAVGLVAAIAAMPPDQ